MTEGDPDGPRLFVLCGLPGVGKTTVGELLVEHLDATAGTARHEGGRLLRTDVIRKELVADPTYSDAETERVYGTLFDRAATALEAGTCPVLDGTFRDRPLRDRAVGVAERVGVPVVFVEVTCAEATAIERIRARTDDESDAEVADYDRFREIFDALERDHVTVDNSGDLAATRERVRALF